MTQVFVVQKPPKRLATVERRKSRALIGEVVHDKNT
jgi:hypothetical protein